MRLKRQSPNLFGLLSGRGVRPGMGDKLNEAELTAE
jgi:hypothetical protein